MEIDDQRKRNRILAVLFMGVLMGALDIAIVGPVLPDLQETFGVDERVVAWVYGMYILTGLIGTPLTAKLADLVGRRRVYVADVLLFACGSLVVAAAATFPILLAGRAVQGFAAGGVFPVASAVIGDTFPAERRGRALGILGAVFGLAFIIGPILAGVLLRHDWRWLFLVNIPVAAALVVASLRILPAGHAGGHRSLDWPGIVLLSGSLTAFALGVNRLDATRAAASMMSIGVLPFMVAAILGGVAFVSVERGAQDPVLSIPVFSSRQAFVVLGLALAIGIVEAAVIFVPDLLVEAFGVTKSEASFMLVPIVVAMTIGAPLSGRMLDQVGSRMVIASGSLLLGAGLVAVGHIGTSVRIFYLAASLVGLGMAAVLGAPLRYVLLNEAPPRHRAAAQAGLSLAISVGQLVGGALIGATVASFGGGFLGYESAFRMLGFIAGFMVLASLALKGRRDELAGAAGAIAAPVPAVGEMS